MRSISSSHILLRLFCLKKRCCDSYIEEYATILEVPYVTSCPSVSLVGLSVGWSVDLSENSLKGGELHFHASNGSDTGSFLACCFATREKTFSLAAALID